MMTRPLVCNYCLDISCILFIFFCLLIDYIIESEPLVNKYISVPKDKGSLNCSAFIGGIIEAILNESNFVCIRNHFTKFLNYFVLLIKSQPK